MFGKRKKGNPCRDCPGRQACEKTDMKPVIGQCSLTKPGQRESVLAEMRDAVRKDGIVFLRKPVRVMVDYCGIGFGFTVRKFGPFPGVLVDSLQFSLGKDEYGSDVSTEDVSTKDLEAVMAAIH